MNPDRPGRPSQLTPEVHRGIVEGVRSGNFINVAAAKMRIKQGTLRRWLRNGRKFPDGLYGKFRADVFHAKAEFENQLVETAKDGATGDYKFALEMLAKRFPSRWGRDVAQLRKIDETLKQLEEMLDDAGSPQTPA